MSSKQTGSDFNFSYPQAEIAVMGAVNILFRNADDATKAQKLEEYKAQFSKPYRAAENGYIDEIIMPAQTRSKLIQALELCKDKSVTLPPKKHGNMAM